MGTLSSAHGHRGNRPVSGSLRQKVKQIALAPFRIHHYRDVHTRMLRDALCQLDCSTDHDAADE